ncbi:MAG: serine/threonine protein phosphatase [Rhodobacteraceae bacterium]|nr:serine/threonine protein phosphatase [Paracoccaceae bacterium]
MISNLIQRLLGKFSKNAGDDEFPPIAPARQFVVIGDIHGCIDLLDLLLARIEPDCPLVFVGDYIDRGPDSAGVLRRLKQLTQTENREVICLLGNHEEMLLRFVHDPKRVGQLWLQNGGMQTLASFGVAQISGTIKGAEAAAVAELLCDAMGEDLLQWLRNLPLTWQSGNVIVSHAALDPSVPLADQDRRTLLWGHPLFGRKIRSDGLWVVHGHTVMQEPRVQGGVVSVDTGAFSAGRLTAAQISVDSVRFVTVDSCQRANEVR